MHRLIVRLLLLLLPMQLSWGVAAAYCGHEAAGSAAAAHFGHHVHVHQAPGHRSPVHHGHGAAAATHAPADQGGTPAAPPAQAGDGAAASAQPAQTPADAGHGAGLPLPGTDADCHACQGAPGVMMPAMPVLASVGPTTTGLPWSAPELPAPPPAPLERPNWQDLA
ncbi:MAG: hypothetical protein RLZZ584_1061 [Pseudomonadota bacterium]|jgi:hypothetical protein